MKIYHLLGKHSKKSVHAMIRSFSRKVSVVAAESTFLLEGNAGYAGHGTRATGTGPYDNFDISGWGRGRQRGVGTMQISTGSRMKSITGTLAAEGTATKERY